MSPPHTEAQFLKFIHLVVVVFTFPSPLNMLSLVYCLHCNKSSSALPLLTFISLFCDISGR